MESILIPRVQAVPVAPYVGGKRLLAKRIIERINEIPHSLYVEPFVGMGGVFLRRPVPARTEVINDISGDVVTLFRVLQRHYSYFVDFLRFTLASRREFERLQATDPTTLTDFERAARFLYLQRVSFGGKVKGRTFGLATDHGSRFNLTRLVPMLDDLHTRLAGVVIENLPYQEAIARYDRDHTLFYLDPPYYRCEDYYGDGVFSREDFTRLAGLLAGIKGRFIMSLNDTPEVREIFAAFRVDAVETRYSLRKNSNIVAGEVLISNA